VPQNTALDWEMPFTVFDVVLMGTYRSLGWFKRVGSTEKDIAFAALEAVNLLSMAQTPICHLSGGQRQRTLLARALAQKSSIYFLDEPFNGVDQVTEQTIITVLKTLRNNGTTILAVHHDLNTAHHYFDWAALLNRTLVAHGPIATVVSSTNLDKTYGKSTQNIFLKGETK
jgi:manganese/zinc/iron transport system ATP- binding protein